MDIVFYDDAARTVHLIGLAMGLGAAIIADMTAVRWLKRPMDHDEIQTLQRYHHIVAAGLFLFWISGFVILWFKTGFQAEQFSAKLMMKLCVVTVLTFNAILIARIGLPALKKYEGYAFCQLNSYQRLRLAVLAALSTASWVSALALGMFKVLADMEWAALTDIFVGVYAVALFGAVCLALVAPMIAKAATQENKDPRLRPLRPISGLQIPSRAL